MEGYADPSTAAQDAMVKIGRRGHVSHGEKKKKLMLKSDSELFKFFCIFSFSGIIDSMGSLSAENRRTQKHAANDTVQQELPAVVDG